MIIKIKQNNGFIKVNVSRTNCKNFKCFVPHKYQHRNYNGTEGSMIRSDTYYSCSNRNYHGCPDNPELKL